MKDLQLLKKLYSIERSWREEHRIVSFIINYCHKELKESNIEFELDHYGNLFITKSTTNPDAFACVIAHMDTCQNYKMQRKIYMQGNKILATYKDGTSAGLGADDSNGIFIALKLLKEIDNIKVLFTVEEETGGTGAREAAANVDFFSDVMYLIQADRRGSHDLIVHTNGIDSASPDFIKRISSISKKYNYFNAQGTFTDVGILAEETRISGINVSCGYYYEHTEREYTNYTELLNCYKFIKSIILETKDENKFYTIEVPERKYGYVKSIYPSEYDDLPCDHCRTFDCMHCTRYNDW